MCAASSPGTRPTVINAVFNFTNFWEGRANPHFNGVNAFGDQDQAQTTIIRVNRPGTGLVQERVSLDNASLASQALAPVPSSIEMSFGDPAQGNGRRLREVGLKLLRPSPQTGVPLTPLGLQKVHRHDSVLGTLSKAPFRGLSTSYEAMIKKAFAEQYWNSTERIPLPSIPSGTEEFTQMEANFGLFFGLAVALYESTLVADQHALRSVDGNRPLQPRFWQKGAGGIEPIREPGTVYQLPRRPGAHQGVGERSAGRKEPDQGDGDGRRHLALRQRLLQHFCDAHHGRHRPWRPGSQRAAAGVRPPGTVRSAGYCHD